MTKVEFELVKAILYSIKNDIKEVRDDLGKVIQTNNGTGTSEDPYKNWKVGDSVRSGKWYITEDGYLWEAIKSGVPASTTDREYFDVVGM